MPLLIISVDEGRRGVTLRRKVVGLAPPDIRQRDATRRQIRHKIEVIRFVHMNESVLNSKLRRAG
jgi:hypothetical protein